MWHYNNNFFDLNKCYNSFSLDDFSNILKDYHPSCYRNTRITEPITDNFLHVGNTQYSLIPKIGTNTLKVSCTNTLKASCCDKKKDIRPFDETKKTIIFTRDPIKRFESGLEQMYELYHKIVIASGLPLNEKIKKISKQMLNDVTNNSHTRRTLQNTKKSNVLDVFNRNNLERLIQHIASFTYGCENKIDNKWLGEEHLWPMWRMLKLDIKWTKSYMMDISDMKSEISNNTRFCHKKKLSIQNSYEMKKKTNELSWLFVWNKSWVRQNIRDNPDILYMVCFLFYPDFKCFNYTLPKICQDTQALQKGAKLLFV